MNNVEGRENLDKLSTLGIRLGFLSRGARVYVLCIGDIRGERMNYPAIKWRSFSRSEGSSSETAQKSSWPLRQSIH